MDVLACLPSLRAQANQPLRGLVRVVLPVGENMTDVIECEACRLGDDKHTPATWVYELATARGRVAVCDRHAEPMKSWSGSLTAITVEAATPPMGNE